jgi:hypothetical protein
MSDPVCLANALCRIRISQNYLSTMGRSDVEIGFGILLKMSRESGKSMEWLLMEEG